MNTAGEQSDRGRLEADARTGRPAGIRNRTLIVPSVICSHVVADHIADHVEGAVAASHDHGCAQIGDDEATTRRTLTNLARNPNIAGALFVGLGCETIQSGSLLDAVRESGIPVESVVIQEVGGTDACIESGIAAIERVRATAGDGKQVRVRTDELTVGIISSDLRESTIRHGEPLVGEVIDRILDNGGRVVVAGSERFVAARDVAENRLATERARDGFATMVDRKRRQSSHVTAIHRRASSLSPQQLLGPLGDRPIEDVLAYGQRATHEQGVALVDAPAGFAEATTALAASGAQIVIHVTAEGVPTGHPVVPVCKVTGSPETAAALPEDIDIDARTMTPDESYHRFRTNVQGTPTCAERHGLSDVAITRLGPSM